MIENVFGRIEWHEFVLFERGLQEVVDRSRMDIEIRNSQERLVISNQEYIGASWSHQVELG
ncbi:MAG: hypothetical protein WBH28_07695 [Fuerstiella sp.]|jgi:hypothetical protein